MYDAFAFLLRGLDKAETEVVVNLVDLRFFGKPLTHQTLAGYLVDTTADCVGDRDNMAAFVHDRCAHACTHTGRTRTCTHAFTHNRCAVNLAAQHVVAPYFDKAIDNDCIPHTMNNVPYGNHATCTPTPVHPPATVPTVSTHTTFAGAGQG